MNLTKIRNTGRGNLKPRLAGDVGMKVRGNEPRMPKRRVDGYRTWRRQQIVNESRVPKRRVVGEVGVKVRKPMPGPAVGVDEGRRR